MVFCISNSTCACLAPIVDRLLPTSVWLEARPHSHGWDTLPRKDTLLQKDTLPGRTLCTGMTLSLRKIFCHKRILHFANTYLSCAVHFPWTIYFPKLIWFYFIHINVKWKFWSCCLIKSSKFQLNIFLYVLCWEMCTIMITKHIFPRTFLKLMELLSHESILSRRTYSTHHLDQSWTPWY